MATPAPDQARKGKETAEERKARKAKEEAQMEEEWQQILEYYEPENVEKREEERLRKESEAEQESLQTVIEREQVLEEYYGIKPRRRPGDLQAAEGFGDADEEQERWDFPPDKDKWTEQDLGEEWADAPKNAKSPFYDPTLGVAPGEDEEEDEADDELEQRRRRKGAKKAKKAEEYPHSMDRFVPYRRGVPPLPEWEDVDEEEVPLSVLEGMEMEEEFLQWASYVFRDGSTYEGTVWNDLAQGKGVYTTPSELCKYEGEWVQNRMEGWGVVSADIPIRVPPPDSEAWLKMKKEGKLEGEAFLSGFDKEWLKMELEDLAEQAKEAKKNPEEVEDPTDPVPFEDHPGWVKLFGKLPEKGHYQYAGQMKQSKFHGCGVFTLNGRMHYGKFHFGEFMFNNEECDAHMSGLHSGLAQVAAAKARMFVGKPDGMVREMKGPYTDPSHPYMYDEEDMWQAPGFINEFHTVPRTWAKYVEEVDKERQSWLNSFFKAPLRLPMPAELSYLWDKPNEFVLLRNEANMEGPPAEEDQAMALPELRGEVLLHVPSQQIINWANDPQGRLRFFVQPFRKDGKVDPSEVRVLPLGFEEFLGEKEAGVEDDEEEDTQGVPRSAAEEAAFQERKRRRSVERRKRRKEAEDSAFEERWAAGDKELEEEWAREDEAEEEVRRLELEQLAQEEELMDQVFEARLDALEGLDTLLEDAEKEETAKEKEEEKEKEKEKSKEGLKGASGSAHGTAGKKPEKPSADKAVAEASRKEGEETEKEDELEDSIFADDGMEEEKEEEEEEVEEEEEYDDDEEVKKPRSFGAAVPSKPAKDDKGGPSRPSGTQAPFASITLSSQAALAGVTKAARLLLARVTSQRSKPAAPTLLVHSNVGRPSYAEELRQQQQQQQPPRLVRFSMLTSICGAVPAHATPCARLSCRAPPRSRPVAARRAPRAALARPETGTLGSELTSILSLSCPLEL